MNKTSRTNKAILLADRIETERRGIGELSFDRLTSPELIESMQNIEQMINEYTLLVYVGRKAQPSGRHDDDRKQFRHP